MTLFLLLLIVTTLYYMGAVLFLFRGFKRLTPPGSAQNLRFSIVIAARNEERNIGACLTGIFGQEISADRYEVIVVNDRSSDATAAICADFAQRHPNLHTITISQTPPGIAPKKHAVSKGIEAAKNEIVVFTDADCLVPPTWLFAIDRQFEKNTGLVQGITIYSRPAGMHPLLFGFQAVDFLSHGIVAASAIGAGMPLNSNANNFAFRKKAFEDAGGYGQVSRKVVSGDDDLLLQRIAGSDRWKVKFMTDPAGAVTTKPTETVKGIFEQRKRWGSKTVNYTVRQVAFLGGVFAFYCGLAASFIAGLFNPALLPAFGGMLMVKICGECLLMIPGTAIFGQKKLRPHILPTSLLQLPVVLAAVILGVFGRFSWKGERFKRTVA